MKKSLIALAALAATASFAQSTVEIYGGLDIGLGQVKGGQVGVNNTSYIFPASQAATGLANAFTRNGLTANFIGFRGTEDLGGGLLAGFWLEAGVSGDTGAAGGGTGYDSTGAKTTGFFNRRSTLSLSGGFGEVRLGRDYTVNFNVSGKFDAYGANGFGNGSNLYANGKLSPFDASSTATKTGAAFTRLRVNKAAVTAGRSQTASARSIRPSLRMPAETAPNRKPKTVPLISRRNLAEPVPLD